MEQVEDTQHTQDKENTKKSLQQEVVPMWTVNDFPVR